MDQKEDYLPLEVTKVETLNPTIIRGRGLSGIGEPEP